MTHSFLLIGQSNMAGRGFLSEAEPLDTCGGRLKVLRNGRWQEMFRPVCLDRPWAGSCLAESFAKAYAESHPGVDVGIIPCADGGTSLDQWAPGDLLFDHAIACARLAMRTSRLVGILWHQGESDCPNDLCPHYREKLKSLLPALRKALELPNLPILLGGLGDFLVNGPKEFDLYNYDRINADMQQVVRDTHNTAFVPATGLGSNPDKLHFSAAALKEFGLRYYAALCGLTLSVNDATTAETDSKRSSMELL